MHLGKKISKPERLFCQHYRWIHATRISLAFLVTFLAIRYFKLDGASYALITMLIVMGPQPYWGNVFSRALQRTGVTVLVALSGSMARLNAARALAELRGGSGTTLLFMVYLRVRLGVDTLRD